jgi:DNA-binding transcriptional regulator YdaS (Cro superfamily)
MTHGQLRAALDELKLTQADFARLIGVTPRAVNLWMAEDRTIPGPAAAYVQLLGTLPANLRQVEFGRLKHGVSAMREGIFGITYQGRSGAGMGMLVFEAGRVYGSDAAKGRYDGGYVFNEASELVDVTLKVTFPPNVASVLGIVNPYEWSIDVTTSFNPKLETGQVTVTNSLGQPLSAHFTFLRELPQAA